MLLKQKEDRIQELETLLHQEKSNSSDKMKLNMSQFQKYFRFSICSIEQKSLRSKQNWKQQ